MAAFPAASGDLLDIGSLHGLLLLLVGGSVQVDAGRGVAVAEHCVASGPAGVRVRQQGGAAFLAAVVVAAEEAAVGGAASDLGVEGDSLDGLGGRLVVEVELPWLGGVLAGALQVLGVDVVAFVDVHEVVVAVVGEGFDRCDEAGADGLRGGPSAVDEVGADLGRQAGLRLREDLRLLLGGRYLRELLRVLVALVRRFLPLLLEVAEVVELDADELLELPRRRHGLFVILALPRGEPALW